MRSEMKETTMQRTTLLTLAVFATAIAASWGGDSAGFRPEAIVALERAAIDRWCAGDPQGYLETYAPDVTYFDPSLERRIDGLGAMKELLTPIAGKIKIDRYEMIGPKVQRQGDVAVLTYNLVNYARLPDGTEKVTSRWNVTEMYRRTGGKWKIAHSHFSFTKPGRKQAGPE